MLPCKHSTFSEYKQFLAFPFRPSSFSKLMSRVFLFAETQKEKANKKVLEKDRGCRGKGKNLFQKVFPFPCRQGAAGAEFGLGDRRLSLRYGVASPQVCYSISQTMCFKSTNVTEQTLYLLRIQTVPCISLQPFFIFKTYAPLFLFFAETQKEKANKKSFGKG